MSVKNWQHNADSVALYIWASYLGQPHLKSYIRPVVERLAADGVFVFSGLEKKIIQIESNRKIFKLLHPIEHRNIFTRKSLQKLLDDHGLHLVTRSEIVQVMKQVRSKAPLYLPSLIRSGFVAVNGVFSALAKLK